jgi:hypothetical protein
MFFKIRYKDKEKEKKVKGMESPTGWNNVDRLMRLSVE